jgi:hypothetical protein
MPIPFVSVMIQGGGGGLVKIDAPGELSLRYPGPVIVVTT